MDLQELCGLSVEIMYCLKVIVKDFKFVPLMFVPLGFRSPISL